MTEKRGGGQLSGSPFPSLHRKTGEVSSQKIKGVVGGEIPDPGALAAAQLQMAAVGAVRGGKAHEDPAHGVIPLVGIRPGHAGDAESEVRPGGRRWSRAGP